MKYSIFLLIVLLISATFCSVCQAEVATVAVYDASSEVTSPDPQTTEGGGWTYISGGSPAVSASTEGSENVWKILANTTSYAYYEKSFSSNTLSGNDWTVTIRVDVDYATSAPGGVIVKVSDGQDVWSLGFLLTSSSDNGWTYLKSDGSYAIPQQPEDVDTMHTWKMVFDSDTQTLEYYRDDIKVGPTVNRADVPDSSSGEYIRWGRQTSSSASTSADWNYIGLDVSGMECGSSFFPYPTADLDFDCKVDLRDFAILASTWQDCTFKCN